MPREPEMLHPVFYPHDPERWWSVILKRWNVGYHCRNTRMAFPKKLQKHLRDGQNLIISTAGHPYFRGSVHYDNNHNWYINGACWSKVVRDLDLRVGDRVLFEHMRREQRMAKLPPGVTIFRLEVARKPRHGHRQASPSTSPSPPLPLPPTFMVRIRTRADLRSVVVEEVGPSTRRQASTSAPRSPGVGRGRPSFVQAAAPRAPPSSHRAQQHHQAPVYASRRHGRPRQVAQEAVGPSTRRHLRQPATAPSTSRGSPHCRQPSSSARRATDGGRGRQVHASSHVEYVSSEWTNQEDEVLSGEDEENPFVLSSDFDSDMGLSVQNSDDTDFGSDEYISGDGSDGDGSGGSTDSMC